jgi:hypothetical protein
MSERIPEYGATEGPAPLAGVVDKDTLDDAFGRASDMMAEQAEQVRQHVCLHPFHVDVSAEFLEAMRGFAFAIDAWTAASEAVQAHAVIAENDPPSPIEIEAAPGADPAWRVGFAAGAVAQRDWMVAYARSRGWVSTATAIELTQPVAPPAITEEATDVRA